MQQARRDPSPTDRDSHLNRSRRARGRPTLTVVFEDLQDGLSQHLVVRELEVDLRVDPQEAWDHTGRAHVDLEPVGGRQD